MEAGIHSTRVWMYALWILRSNRRMTTNYIPLAHETANLTRFITSGIPKWFAYASKACYGNLRGESRSFDTTLRALCRKSSLCSCKGARCLAARPLKKPHRDKWHVNLLIRKLTCHGYIPLVHENANLTRFITSGISKWFACASRACYGNLRGESRFSP